MTDDFSGVSFASTGYHSPVTTYLHRLSAGFFYALGLSFFVAYICVRNDIAANAAAAWMQFMDLPFAFSAIAYGGLSFYLSLTSEDKDSMLLALGIGIPMGLFFIVLIVLNFWGA